MLRFVASVSTGDQAIEVSRHLHAAQSRYRHRRWPRSEPRTPLPTPPLGARTARKGCPRGHSLDLWCHCPNNTGDMNDTATPKPGTLVLVRHGQSEWNLENLFTGWTDVDLTEQGISEARGGGNCTQGRGDRPRRCLNFRSDPSHPHLVVNPRRDGSHVGSGAA